MLLPLSFEFELGFCRLPFVV